LSELFYQSIVIEFNERHSILFSVIPIAVVSTMPGDPDDFSTNATNSINSTMLSNSTGNATLPLYHEPTEEEMRHSLFIFYTVMFVMIFAQSALVSWRKRHRRSYELVTLVGLWLVPFLISIKFSLYRFLAVSL